MFLFTDKRKVFLGLMLLAGLMSLYICGAFHEKHEEVRPVVATPVSGKVIVIEDCAIISTSGEILIRLGVSELVLFLFSGNKTSKKFKSQNIEQMGGEKLI